MAKCRCGRIARAARGGDACGLMGSIVLHATFSPTAALLLLLVASLLAICFVLHCCMFVHSENE